MKGTARLLILIAINIFCISEVVGQCDYSGDLLIEDQSSVSIDLLVSGAENNDLSSNNCLKIVDLHFGHTFISDLKLELVSPSNQVFEIIGANGIGANIDPSVSWEVQIVNEEELVAMPDEDHGPVWNSLALWPAFATYDGSYYPYQGNLDNYTGSVNGIWTLIVSDVAELGEGDLSCFGLEFCNEDGIEIASCSPVVSSLDITEVEFCEGSSDLNFDLTPALQQVYDSTAYGYQYLIYQNGNFKEFSLDTDFSDDESGNYTVCGLQYFLDDLAEIENIPSGSSEAEVLSFLTESGVCGRVSDNCTQVTIFPVAEVITESRILCQGEFIEIAGEIYSEEGLYEITTPLTPCDSISMLDLKVIDMDVQAVATETVLTCDRDTLLLDASGSTLLDDAVAGWITTDGNIIGSTLSDSIYTNTSGTYTYQATSGGCVFTKDIVITEDSSFVIFNIDVPQITCLSDSALINIISSDSIVDVKWESDQSFRQIENDIITGQAGIYNVEFATKFGCVVRRDLEVEDNRVYPFFELEGDTLSCLEPSVLLTTTEPDTLNSNFIWLYGAGVVGNSISLLANRPGEYNLRVTTDEGCVDTFSIDIPSIADTLNVDLIGGSIDCDEPSIDIAYVSEQSGLSILWTLPDETTLVDSTFVSSLEGTYLLELEDDKGCSLDTFLLVEKDTEIPDIQIIESIFLCGVDSLQLTYDLNVEDVEFLWTSESGYHDTTSAPYIFEPGEYMVEVCTSSGCCDLDTFNIGIDQDLPDLTFEFADINCDHDTVYIEPSDTSTYEMEWFLDAASLAVNSNIIEITNPGLYEVIVTNEVNGCSSNYSFDIIDDRVDTLAELSADILNCLIEEVQIEVETEGELEFFTWTGPSLLDTSLEPMVDEPGTYYIEFEYTNGCSNVDSIEVLTAGELPNLNGDDKILSCAAPSVILGVTYESNSISITWEGPDFEGEGEFVTVQEPGIYNVYAVAPGACRDTIQINVAADTIPPVISLTNDGIITCLDSIVQVDLTIDANTTSYFFEGPGIISENGQTFEVDKPGIYFATASADNGCMTIEEIEVSNSTDFPDYEIDLDSITCVEDEVTVGFTSSDPSLQVEWVGVVPIADDIYNFSTSTAGNYIFTLTNIDGCVISDSFFVLRDTFPPLGGIIQSSQITCDSSDVRLSIENDNPEWSVEWQGPGVIDPSSKSFITDVIGEYITIITGANGCITLDTTAIVYDTLSPNISVVGDPISCTAGKVFILVDSDQEIREYSWEGPNDFESNDITPLVSDIGMYNVTVTSINGCQSIGEIEVEDIREFPVIEVDDFYLPCDGAPALATYSFISEGAEPRWLGPDDYFSNLDTAEILTAGMYVGVALTQEGCSSRDTFFVIDEAVPPIFDAAGNTLLCFGAVEISALQTEDDRSISWSGPNGFMSEEISPFVNEPGVYTLSVIGTNGCEDNKDVILLDGRIYPDAVAVNNDLFQCENLSINLSANGSSEGSQFTYQWTTEDGVIIEGDRSLNPLIDGEGIYIIEVTNNSIGCISYDTLVLLEQEADLVDVIIDITPPTCQGFDNGILELTEIVGGFGPYEITLDGNSYGERTDILYLMTGEHELKIVDSLGCFLERTVVIDESTLLTVDLPNDTTLLFGQSFDVFSGINLSSDSIAEINWSSNVPCMGCDSFSINPNDNMTITIEVIDLNGCVVTEEFRITLDRPNNLPFPQIFSPNGDDINDVFYMPMTTGLQTIDFIRVFDNWGGLVYEAIDLVPGDPTFGWNGVLNGQNAEMAVYIVEAIVTLTDGTQVRYTGDLTLVR